MSYVGPYVGPPEDIDPLDDYQAMVEFHSQQREKEEWAAGLASAEQMSSEGLPTDPEHF